jgi:hypothetical protein
MSETTLKKISGEFTQRSDVEFDNDQILHEIARRRYQVGGFGPQWNYHSSIFIKRQVLSRLLYQDFLYKKILNTPGVICEFGVHWGTTMVQLCNLRGMYEPFNHSRIIYGFDTFSGFPNVDVKDGGLVSEGDYSSEAGYESELEQILSIHESFSPVSHIKKFDLIKGDVTQTFPKWLDENPHAIISMAVFDMDIYAPTKAALSQLIPRLTKGSILVFDELNAKFFPGETQAVSEVLGLNNLRLQRFPHQPFCAFAEFGA